MGGVAREGAFNSFRICGDLTIKEKQIREEASKGVTPLWLETFSSVGRSFRLTTTAVIQSGIEFNE